MIRLGPLPRHRAAVPVDNLPTTYPAHRRGDLAWLDVVPTPSGRMIPRHRADVLR